MLDCISGSCKNCSLEPLHGIDAFVPPNNDCVKFDQFMLEKYIRTQ